MPIPIEAFNEHSKGTSLREIARKYKVSLPAVRYWAKKYGIKVRSREEANKLRAIQPDLSPTPDLCRLLGLLKGDGCTYSRGKKHCVQFENTSYELVNDVANLLQKIGLKPSIRESKRKNKKSTWAQSWIVTASSKVFVEWYRGLSFVSLRKIVLSDANCSIAFLRGFYEAEGCLYFHRGAPVITITNSNVQLLALCRHIISRVLGIKSFKRHNKNLWVLTIYRSNDVTKFLQILKPTVRFLKEGLK